MNDDLLAGLTHSQPEPVAAADDVAALRAALAFHRGHLQVCDNYAHTSSEPSFAALARDLTEGHQEAIYLLARALRRAGAPAGEVEADRRIVAASWRQADAPAKARFLAAASQQAIARYQAQAAAGFAERATWEELAALAQAQAAAIRKLT
jgi:hypothetical protein